MFIIIAKYSKFDCSKLYFGISVVFCCTA